MDPKTDPEMDPRPIFLSSCAKNGCFTQGKIIKFIIKFIIQNLLQWLQKNSCIITGKSPFGERDDSCFQVKTSILYNNNPIDGNVISLTAF